MGAFRNLAGQTYGRLTVQRRVANKPYIGNAVWWCHCACGKQLAVVGLHLTSGNTKSCGCLQRETVGKMRRTHALSRTREYETWCGLKKRCTNARSKAYADYGGRGIKVCDRWASFDTFLADVGTAPSKKHTIDRINNDGDYEPGNVRWASKLEQANNTRANRHVSYNGETLTVAQWGRRLKVPYGRIKDRLNWGWSIERALTTPAQR